MLQWVKEIFVYFLETKTGFLHKQQNMKMYMKRMLFIHCFLCILIEKIVDSFLKPI